MWLLNLQCEQTRSQETSRGQAVYKTDKTADTRTIQTGEEKKMQMCYKCRGRTL